MQSHISLTNKSGGTSFGTWSGNVIFDSRNGVSSPFSLLLAKRVVRNESWRVAFRDLAVVHCESWPACFISIYIFFFCYHPTRQLKLNTHCIQNPLETNWSFTSTMFTLIIIVLFFFFFLCRPRRNAYVIFFYLYLPKFNLLHWENCVILRIWHCSYVTDTIVLAVH